LEPAMGTSPTSDDVRYLVALGGTTDIARNPKRRDRPTCDMVGSGLMRCKLVVEPYFARHPFLI
jgi:hypothetical protein